jgi:hypothetical protein
MHARENKPWRKELPKGFSLTLNKRHLNTSKKRPRVLKSHVFYHAVTFHAVRTSLSTSVVLANEALLANIHKIYMYMPLTCYLADSRRAHHHTLTYS